MVLKVLGIFLLWSFAGHAQDQQGCTADGKTFKVGESNPIPNVCVSNVCLASGQFGQLECGLFGLPYKWVFVPEDPSKPYPKCCGYGVPPLKIVPDLLHSLRFSDFLNVTYAGGVKVDMGNQLTLTQVRTQPEVSYTPVNDSLYLLAVSDPDAPNPQKPELREFLLWLVVNIPGNDLAAGEVLAEYLGSGPSGSTGLHRYVFLLFRQPGKLTFEEPRITGSATGSRGNFRVQALARKYGLGDPVALNVLQAQHGSSGGRTC